MTAVFAALADPTRRRILERLTTRGDAQVTALAKPFRMSLPAISRHLRVLERARLVERHREGRVHRISARATGLKDVQDWIAHCVNLWESRFDAIDHILKTQPRKDDNP